MMFWLVFLVKLCWVASALTEYQMICTTPVKEPGTCVLVKECNFIRRVLAKLILNENDLHYIEASRCGTYENKALVCCPKSTGSPPYHNRVDSIDSDDTGNLSDRRKLLPLPSECGVQYDDRIVGGERTGIATYPWIARIQHVDQRNNSAFHCAGSLINQRYVLTAAHCLAGVPRGWTITAVRLGEWDIETNPDCDDKECYDEVQDIDVEKLIVHENFVNQRTEVHNDIGLLRLVSPARYSETVSPICLPLDRRFENHPTYGAKLFVTGWGQTEADFGSRFKMHVSVPRVTLQQCRRKYPAANIDERQICAGGQPGKDSCKGDSGGPLMEIVSSTGHQAQPAFYMMGVVSYGKECGLENVPGVYTKVNRFADWILSHIES
ncbi:CLIP domain-containing serine protease B4-like [Armigeres subalbatus]|uniref:CLIP domain-containing serine protease B4-like n=1 Tax=Armigeres subalbatus TaxID=124917 RepID=UPI002ED4E5D0